MAGLGHGQAGEQEATGPGCAASLFHRLAERYRALFVAHGADPDARNSHRDTALMIAAAQGDGVAARILLAAGAKASLRNLRRETAHDLASAAGHGDVAALLTGGGSWLLRSD